MQIAFVAICRSSFITRSKMKRNFQRIFRTEVDCKFLSKSYFVYYARESTKIFENVKERPIFMCYLTNIKKNNKTVF